MWQDIKQIIEDNEEFLLTTHINPDGDGIGSAVALMELLLSLGKKVIFVCDTPLSEKFRFLDYHGLFCSLEEISQKLNPQVVIILDTSKEERIGKVAEWIYKEGVVSVCIDHHPVEKIFTPHAVIDSNACCVGTMIYSLYKHEYQKELNYQAASGIYTSIITDTGRFSYESTSQQAHQIAEACMNTGINPCEMYSRLFQQVPLYQVQIFKQALMAMELHCDQKVALWPIRYEDYASMCGDQHPVFHQDLDFIHEFNKGIQGIECGVILWELPDQRVRVSVRSKSSVNSTTLMAELGGGGHPHAAGAMLKDRFDTAKNRIISLLEKNFQ